MKPGAVPETDAKSHGLGEKNMKISVLIVSCLILSSPAIAEDKPPAKVVRVTGTAEVKVVPDRAVIEIGVEQQNSSASAAKSGADAVARRVLAGLRDGGVEEKDIQTTFLALRPQFDYRKGMRISYFVAEQTMSVTVRDLSKLDALLESLIKAGGNRIDTIDYETSDLRKYRDQAREQAVKAAREKAEALAAALGQQIGKAQAIEEMVEPAYQGYGFLPNTTTAGNRSRGQGGPSLAAGQKSISASVVVSFDLI
jgi:uncharacterized protein YggE